MATPFLTRFLNWFGHWEGGATLRGAHSADAGGASVSEHHRWPEGRRGEILALLASLRSRVGSSRVSPHRWFTRWGDTPWSPLCRRGRRERERASQVD